MLCCMSCIILSPIVSPGDYTALEGYILHFNAGDGKRCVDINITQDDTCEEEPEDFVVNLSLANGVQPIELIRTQAKVTIDDKDEFECSKYEL